MVGVTALEGTRMFRSYVTGQDNYLMSTQGRPGIKFKEVAHNI